MLTKTLKCQLEVSKEVTDADVDARIERERNNLAELVVKEGAAAEGDTVVIDFVVLSTVLNSTVVKVTTSHLDLVQVNSSQVSKTNWLDTLLVKQLM